MSSVSAIGAARDVPSMPVGTLPHRALLMPDLLTYIFTLAAADGIVTKSHAPLNISLTCRAWRRVALDVTRLWSRVELEVFFDPTKTRVADKAIALLQLWLSRSGNQPLYLSVKLVCEQDDSDPAKFATHLDYVNRRAVDLIQILTSYQSRWRNVSIVSLGACLPGCFQSTLSHTPLLTCLELGYVSHSPHFYWPSEQPLVGNAIGPSGRLEPVYILNPPAGPIFYALRTLSIHLTADCHEAADSLLVLLRHAPNVLEMKVYYCLTPGQYGDESRLLNVQAKDPVSLSKLRILHWETMSVSFTDAIAPQLSFPVLEEISLQLDKWMVTSIDDWLRAHNVTQRIARLTLGLNEPLLADLQEDWDPDQLHPLFVGMTSLRRLHLGELDLREELWDTLICGADGIALLCPALENLEMSCRWGHWNTSRRFREPTRADYEVLVNKMVACVNNYKPKVVVTLTMWRPKRKEPPWFRDRVHDTVRVFKDSCEPFGVSVESEVLEVEEYGVALRFMRS